MIDKLKGLQQLGQLMGRAGEMRAKFEQMQEELADKRVSADAGGGLVQATCNGKLELVGLKISADRIGLTNGAKPEDIEMLEDLIVAAVAAAQRKAAEMAQAEMAKAAEGIGLPADLLKGMGQ